MPPEVRRTDIEIAALLRPIWELNKKILLRRGVDLPVKIKGWCSRAEMDLVEWQSIAELTALSRSGCSSEVLLLCVLAITTAVDCDETMRNVFGSARKRKAMTRTLIEAATVLESVHGSLVRRFGIPPRELSLADSESASLDSLAFWLRNYAAVLEFIGMLRAEREGPLDLCKYALTAYVEYKTGREHDREVTSLIAVGMRDRTYSEAAHKMWRSRNFARLYRAHPEYSTYLSAFAIVLNS